MKIIIDGKVAEDSGGGGTSLPPGGTTNQVLAKASDADGDVECASAILSTSISNAIVLTEAEYNALTTKPSNVLYIMPEEA